LQTGVDRELIRRTVRQAFLTGGHPYQQAQVFRHSVTMLPRDQLRLQRYAAGLWDSGVSERMYNLRVDQFAQRMWRDRARMIARTETIRAAQQGQLAAWDQAVTDGILEPERTWRVWIAVASACDICLSLNGTEVRLNDEWPGYGMVASAHPQCKCSQGLKFHDDDIVRQPPTAKAWVVKPLGQFADWDACVRTMTGKLGSRQAAERYCGKLQSLIEEDR